MVNCDGSNQPCASSLLPTRFTLRIVASFLIAVVGVWLVTPAVKARHSAGDILLANRTPGAIRVMTWNVDDDGIFPVGTAAEPDTDSRSARFARVIRALHPDVMCLQELTRPAEDVGALVNAVLSPSVADEWHAHAFEHNVIASRFPLIDRTGGMVTMGPLRRGHAVALVDLPDRLYARDLYVICAHFQSRATPEEIALRQRHADSIVAWIREAQSTRGQMALREKSPLLVIGDLNVIDDQSPSLNTLLTGAIADRKTFGPSIRPDWNSGPLVDALPHQNETKAETYTWRDDTQPYPPAALDRILYTASVISISRSFVLNTTRLSKAQLSRNGLRANDVVRDPERDVFDHLPVVADLVIKVDRGAKR